MCIICEHQLYDEHRCAEAGPFVLVRNARDFPTMAGGVATTASLWATLSTNALNASAWNGVRSCWLPRLRLMLSWKTSFLFRFYPRSRIKAIAILKNAIQEESHGDRWPIQLRVLAVVS